MEADDRIWEQWLAWLPSAPPFTAPGPALAHYHTVLVGAGRTEADAHHDLDVIMRLMRDRTDGWQALFNNIYENPTPIFSTAPNALVVAAVRDEPPGRALDLATGQGRNAVFLARQGWAVTAVDISDTGLAIAAENARLAGAAIETVLTSVDAFDPGVAAWDLIVATYAPAPVVEAAYVRRLARGLSPRGLVVVESFASDASEAGRRPVDIDPAALREAFAGFETLRFEDTVDVPEWDPTPTRIVRFLARKP